MRLSANREKANEIGGKQYSGTALSRLTEERRCRDESRLANIYDPLRGMRLRRRRCDAGRERGELTALSSRPTLAPDLLVDRRSETGIGAQDAPHCPRLAQRSIYR